MEKNKIITPVATLFKRVERRPNLLVSLWSFSVSRIDANSSFVNNFNTSSLLVFIIASTRVHAIKFACLKLKLKKCENISLKNRIQNIFFIPCQR